jgi:allantoinase
MRRAIRSERVLVDGVLRPATVVIDAAHGVIEDVVGFGEPMGEIPTETRDDALLPGLVDTHVHLNEPGRTEWEGFETATRAAAWGGVTTLVDMPLNCIPVTTSERALEEKHEALGSQLHVDVGFWGGVVPGNARALEAMAKRGMLGAKCFLCHSGIDDFPKSTEADLRLAMPVLRDAGVPLLVHAELEDETVPLCNELTRSYAAFLRTRPASMEEKAIAMMIALARELRTRVHVVHLSTASALPMIRAAKDEGLPFTVETCPHYLCLEAEEIPDGATHYKCMPPIRDRENREKLWEGVRDGTIDLVTSDHSPCTPGLKKPDEGDFCGAWGGIASLSLGLPSVWKEAHARGLSLETVVDRMSAAPARLAGIADEKGRIVKGLAADLCAFDPDAEWLVREEDLRFRHHVSPFVGRTMRGRVRQTWLRGAPIDPARARGAAITST